MIDTSEKLGLSAREAAHLAGIAVSTLYLKMDSGELVARKLGRRTVILRRDLEKFLSGLPLKSEPSAVHRRAVQQRWTKAKAVQEAGAR